MTKQIDKLRFCKLTLDCIEEDFDTILQELQELKAGKDWAKFNDLLSTLTMYDLYLMKEGVPLSRTVREKLYSAIW